MNEKAKHASYVSFNFWTILCASSFGFNEAGAFKINAFWALNNII